MEQDITVTGMILSAASAGEFDKRLVILTKEHGKITAFAKGARRPNSTLLAKTNPFSFGTFVLIPGRNAYHLRNADIQNYFRELALDYENACYGFYFLEFADYYTKESGDEVQMLKLLYQSMRALLKPNIPTKLVRYIFELKALVINGEFPQLLRCYHCGQEMKTGYFLMKERKVVGPECRELAADGIYLNESAMYTLQYIMTSSIEKLYTFVVSEDVFQTIEKIMNLYTNQYIEKRFKTLDVLEKQKI